MPTYLIGGRLRAGGGRAAGEITVRQLVPKSLICELALNTAESIDATLNLPLVDPATGAVVDLPEILIPGRDYIGVMVDGQVVGAGPIWSDPFTFPHTDRIIGAGLWSYFDHRYVLPVLTAGQLPRHVTSRWTGLSLRTIVKRLVQQANGHPLAGLPIDFEADIAGTHEREYPGSDGMSVGQALRNLTEVEGGPEIAFRPYLTADKRHVRWSLVTGDPELTQQGEAHYWDTSVLTPHASILSLDRSADELASRSYTVGVTLRNLIPNGDFEDGIDNVATGAGSNAPQQGPSTGWSSPKYVYWTSTGAAPSWLNVKSNITVEAGDTVTFHYRGRATPSRPMGAMLRFFNGAGDQIGGDTYGAEVNAPAAPGWTSAPIFVTATVPAGATTCRAYLYGQASAGGQTFGADGLMLVQSGDVVPFDRDSVQMQATAESSTLTDAGFPILESWDSRSSVLREATLQAYSEEAVLRGSMHVTSRPMSVRRDKAPKLGNYLPGDYAKIRVKKSGREPAGTVIERIVRISFGVTGDVSVEVAPQRVASGYPVPPSTARWFATQFAALSARIDEANRKG